MTRSVAGCGGQGDGGRRGLLPRLGHGRGRAGDLGGRPSRPMRGRLRAALLGSRSGRRGGGEGGSRCGDDGLGGRRWCEARPPPLDPDVGRRHHVGGGGGGRRGRDGRGGSGGRGGRGRGGGDAFHGRRRGGVRRDAGGRRSGWLPRGLGASDEEECGLGGDFPLNPYFYRLQIGLRVGPLNFFMGLRV